MLTLKQKMVTAAFALGVFVLIVDLVRRRKLSEEFSWVWLMGGSALIVFAAVGKVFDWISYVTGIVEPTSIVFFFGIVFLILVSLQVSVKLSANRERVKNLAQLAALQQREIEELKQQLQAKAAASHPDAGQATTAEHE